MSDLQIKICGVKNQDIAQHAVDAGASFIGFIFYEKSHRNITVENCEEILSEIKDLTIPVAVTVNPDDSLLDDLSRIGFKYIQLHGQETYKMVERIKLTNSSNLDGANANTNPSRTATHPKMVTISETTITHPSSYQTSNNRRIHYLAKLPK